MTEYERKYLIRLASNAIPHGEFARWGKRPVAIIERLGASGLAECLDLDGQPAEPGDDDAMWQITDAGLAKIGKRL